MINKDLIALVQRQLDAYNSKDLLTFCSCYHKEVVFIELLSNSLLCQGLESFKEMYRNLFSSSPELHCKLKKRIKQDGAIVDEEWITGAAKYPNGLHATAIYAFRDGLIDRVWIIK